MAKKQKPSKTEQDKNYRKYREVMNTAGPEEEINKPFSKLTMKQKLTAEHRPLWDIEKERTRKDQKIQAKRAKQDKKIFGK